MTNLRRLRRISPWVFTALIGVTSPVSAQVDFSGGWTSVVHEDLGYRIDGAGAAGGIDGASGPAFGDYTGLPLNDAARRMADSWDARIHDAREHQTIGSGLAAWWVFDPGRMRISNVIEEASERLVGLRLYHINIAGTGSSRTIWLDGRPHPPEYAAHTWAGFSTGHWDGDILTVETTHVKAGWIRRNGAPASDQATIAQHVIRHGNVLTIVSIVTDPIYLEEPYIASSSWTLDVKQQLGDPISVEIVDEIRGQPAVYVPHYLPGENPFLREFSERFGLPFEATRGGKKTTYPEYQLTLKVMGVGQPKLTTR
jgi:hypothetical protein